MKIYFYSCKKNINSYLLISEASKEAILIDPCDIPEYFVKRLENAHISLKAVCITNQNIEEIKRGVKTWQKIYDFLTIEPCTLFKDPKHNLKTLQLSSFNIEAFYVENQRHNFCMYKIENCLFIGQSLLTLNLQPSPINKPPIKNKMKDFDDHTVIFPFSGPPTLLKNLKLKETHLKQALDKATSYIS